MQDDQVQPDMQLIEIMTQVLETGLLPMAVERKIHRLLDSKEISEAEMMLIDQFIDALAQGDVQAIA
ncbi:MAG: hypothetical protein IGS48_19780 [Oscillatoriales cyanobacterium C42_A2020_001]|nr:hypothetical protein [Leptolyngbyaceae cyanobacterium C42_A2020_001]